MAMQVTTFRHDGLGNSSYLVDCGDGSAVVVDPDRNVARYIDAAQQADLRIVAALETHLHADFVTGSRELAHATGAEVHAPAEGHLRFTHRPVSPGDHFALGGLMIDAIASPGHTTEHLSYVMRGHDDDAPSLFSGGSLIFGGAARTDLLGADLTDSLTRAQYRTITAAFAALPDDTVLLPTHGAGSFCSVGSTRGRGATLGDERRTNPLLSHESEDEFARWFPSTFPSAPTYFLRMRPANEAGPRLRAEITAPPALDVDQFDDVRRTALVVDTRTTEEYAQAHISGSLSNPFRPAFSVWLGWLAPADASIAFIADETQLACIVDEAMLVGFETFAGWLAGGTDAWQRAGKEVANSRVLDANAARTILLDGAIALDVREMGEHGRGHLPDAVHIPLGQIADSVDVIPYDRPIVAYCGHGERASSGISILERMGYRDLVVLAGGFGAWRDAGLPTETDSHHRD
jgi:hydroxyacylglutathione hydrolase